MDAVYLCLTCLRVSALAGECHDRLMIRCGNFEPSPNGHDGGPAHWLVETISNLQTEQPEETAD